ncbi:hypothetical protein P4E94_18405, partial [Pontiellaceae bacterium B12219]|nr:hypothetical protein [Pontiellaceae bacterium B12219]
MGIRKINKVNQRTSLLVSSLMIVATAQAALVGEWTFDAQTFENSGTAGSVHDGTFVTENTDFFSTNTISGSGYSLRIQSKAESDSIAGGDVLLINNSSTADAGYLSTFDNTSFSVSMWVRTEDADWFQWDEFAGKSLESGVKDGWALRSKTGDTIRFDSYDDGSKAESSTDALDQSWHMITATYDKDSKDMKLYIDGVLEAT